MRATVGRLAHERFTDERVGELLAERGAARRARGRHRARRPARLRQGPSRPRRARGRDGARRRGGARRVDAGARGQRLRALRALPGAQHRAAPALQRVLPRGRASLRPAARRLRAGHDAPPRCATPSSACATASSRSWPRRPRSTTPSCAWARSPRPASARCSGTVLRAIGVDDEQWRLDEATHPFEATIAMTDVRLTTRYDEADMDSLYSRCTSSATGSTSTRSTPPSSARRSPAAPRAPGTSRRAGCGRTWSGARAASGAGACRTRRRPSPSASPA